jgi:hypothetical protein
LVRLAAHLKIVSGICFKWNSVSDNNEVVGIMTRLYVEEPRSRGSVPCRGKICRIGI